jgi:hypothetical protein
LAIEQNRREQRRFETEGSKGSKDGSGLGFLQSHFDRYLIRNGMRGKVKLHDKRFVLASDHFYRALIWQRVFGWIFYSSVVNQS